MPCLPACGVGEIYLVCFPYQAHPFSLSTKNIAYVGFTGLLDHLWAYAEVLDFHANLVAWTNLVAELYLVQRCKEEQGTVLKLLLVAQGSSTSLCHCFAEDDTWYYRVFRKVSFEEELFFCECMLAYASFIVAADDFIYEEERIAMWQK